MKSQGPKVPSWKAAVLVVHSWSFTAFAAVVVEWLLAFER